MKQIITLLAILSFGILNAQMWIPQGLDIDGDASSSEKSGYSVSINAAGDRIIVGAKNADQPSHTSEGYAHVYDFDGNNWIYQSDIPYYGADFDYFGHSTAINSIGNRVVVGAPQNQTNNYSGGKVSIYDFDGNNWINVGTIQGNLWGSASYSSDDENGSSVAINALGNRVATGAPRNNGNGYEAGQVRIFEQDSTSWVVLGAEFLGEEIEDLSGTSIALNSLGDRVAIGAPGNNYWYGHVRVYEYRYVSYAEFLNTNSNDFTQNPGTPPILVGAQSGWNTDPNHMYWIQMGEDIDGLAQFDRYGGSVSMNDLGDKIAVGVPYLNQVRIFEWNGVSWTQLGAEIVGEANDDEFGGSVSFNALGDRVAIGAYENDGNGADAGHVRIYVWDGTSWNQQGVDIDGEAANDFSGFSVSMNANGDRVAIGAPWNDDSGINSGHVRVYAYGQSNGCVVNTLVVNNAPLLTATNYSYASYQWLDCNNNYGILAGENNYQLNASSNGNYAVEISYTNGCIDTSSCFLVNNIADTCSILDSITITIFDTIITYDTLTTQVFDTITIYDTLTTQVYDTLITYDTIYLGVTDTLYIDVNISGIPAITNTIKVYPNPTSDQVVIDNGNYTAMGGYHLKILNSIGQQVFNSPINQAVFTIDISQFGANGLYYLQILNSSLNVVEVKHIMLH